MESTSKVPEDVGSVGSVSELCFPADPFTNSLSREEKDDVCMSASFKRTRVSIQEEIVGQEEDDDFLAEKLLATENAPLLSKVKGHKRSRTYSWNQSLTYARSIINSVSLAFSTSIRKLQKSMGFAQGFFLIVGILIGSGIFLSPSLVVKETGDMGIALVIWLACGIIALLGSLCFVELGCAIEKAGGNYAYIFEAYGPIPAFLCSWTTAFVIDPAGLAAVTLTFGTYLVKPFVHEEEYTWLPKVLAASCIFLVAFVNCWSVKVATRAQAIFTLAQILAVLFIVVLGTWQMAIGKTDNFKTMFNGTTAHFNLYQLGHLGTALYNGLWAYDGWALVSNVTEEMHNLERNLFLSIITGIPFVIVCYLAVNCSLMTVLNTKQLGSSETVAITFVQKILGKKVAYIMPIFVALSCYGAANGTVFACGRLTLAASREGHMPDVLSMIHRKRLTPIPAVILTSVIAGCMLAPDGSSLESLVGFFNFTCWTMYGLSIFAVIVLRIRKPHLVRPYKVWIITPIVMTLVSLLLVAFPFINKPVESAIALAAVLSGLPVYFIFVYKEASHPQCFKNLREATTKFLKRRMNLSPCQF